MFLYLFSKCFFIFTSIYWSAPRLQSWILISLLSIVSPCVISSNPLVLNIRLAKKFIQVFSIISCKNPNELFGQPNVRNDPRPSPELGWTWIGSGPCDSEWGTARALPVASGRMLKFFYILSAFATQMIAVLFSLVADVVVYECRHTPICFPRQI